MCEAARHLFTVRERFGGAPSRSQANRFGRYHHYEPGSTVNGGRIGVGICFEAVSVVTALDQHVTTDGNLIYHHTGSTLIDRPVAYTRSKGLRVLRNQKPRDIYQATSASRD